MLSEKVSSVIEAYLTLQDKTRENTLLRRVFEKVEVLEPGKGRRPAKLLVKGFFRHDFFFKILDKHKTPPFFGGYLSETNIFST